MRDFIEFIDEGEQPFWKIRELKDYLKTLDTETASKYQRELVDWIHHKGVNSYDRKFIAQIRKIPKEWYWMAEDLFLDNSVNFFSIKEKLKLEKNAKEFVEEFIFDPKYLYEEGFSPDSDSVEELLENNFLDFYNQLTMRFSHSELLEMTCEESGKTPLKEGFDILNLCIRFRDLFEYQLPNYTHKKAILFIYNYFRTGNTLSTISNYLRKRKRKSGYFYS